MATMAIEINHETETRLPRILIADDQPDVLEALRLLLKGHGYSTESVASPAAMLEAIANKEFDLILMDLNYARDTTSGREGLDLLAQLQARRRAANRRDDGLGHRGTRGRSDAARRRRLRRKAVGERPAAGNSEKTD